MEENLEGKARLRAALRLVGVGARSGRVAEIVQKVNKDQMTTQMTVLHNLRNEWESVRLAWLEHQRGGRVRA